MKSRMLLFIAFLLLIQVCSAETVSLLLGEQYNFTLQGSPYAVALIGITKDSATFTVSGIRVGPTVNETKVVDLTEDRVGDMLITLDSIMPNSTVSINLSYDTTGEEACKPVGEICNSSGYCCVGKCIDNICNYPPTTITNATVNVTLDAPENVAPGSIVALKVTTEDDNAVPDAIVDVIMPSSFRLTLTTNESGEGSYIASQEGNYSYVIYDYILISNKTTFSGTPAPPPPSNNTTAPDKPPPPIEPPKQPVCGDKVCNGNENCSSCSKDCRECPAPTPAQKPQEFPSPIWLGVMLLAIAIILRIVLPVFFKDDDVS